MHIEKLRFTYHNAGEKNRTVKRAFIVLNNPRKIINTHVYTYIRMYK